MPANKITVPTKISASVAFNRKNHMKLATTINDASSRAFLAPRILTILTKSGPAIRMTSPAGTKTNADWNVQDQSRLEGGPSEVLHREICHKHRCTG